MNSRQRRRLAAEQHNEARAGGGMMCGECWLNHGDPFNCRCGRTVRVTAWPAAKGA